MLRFVPIPPKMCILRTFHGSEKVVETNRLPVSCTNTP